MSIAREGARFTVLDDELRPVAVIFDLVNPIATLGWLSTSVGN
jgi:hypothetical protein